MRNSKDDDKGRLRNGSNHQTNCPKRIGYQSTESRLSINFEVMDIQSTRLELIKLLLEEKRESVLEKVSQLLVKSDQVVAHTISGEPLTLSNYNQKLEEAEQDITAGRVLDHDELKKKVATWR